MTDSAQPSSGAASAPACGNCGVPVQADAVTCPACGVLLAAYQAPAGASGNETISVADTSATHETASPAMTSTVGPASKPPGSITPPRHTPRSQSPIGDALRRSRESGTSGAEDLASDDAADELARMATSDSPLARAVEAELAGAKVTFDGDAAVIETDRVDLTHTPEGAPVVASHAPAIPVSLPRSQPGRSSSGVAPVVPAGDQRPASGGHDPARVVRWVPFILIGCFVLGFGRSLPGFGGIIGVALVIGLIYVLIKVAAASSRKTTSMPRDDSWNEPRSRRRM